MYQLVEQSGENKSKGYQFKDNLHWVDLLRNLKVNFTSLDKIKIPKGSALNGLK